MPDQLNTTSVDIIVNTYLKNRVLNELYLYNRLNTPNNHIQYNKLKVFDYNHTSFKPSNNVLVNKGTITSANGLMVFKNIASYFSTVAKGMYGISGGYGSSYQSYANFFMGIGLGVGDGREDQYNEHMTHLTSYSGPSGTIVKQNYINMYNDLFSYISNHLNTRTIDLRICHGSCHSNCHGNRRRR